MKIALSCAYHANTLGHADLPGVESWDEVEDWYVKWDTLHYKLKGKKEEWQEYALNSNTEEVIDWKYPAISDIYPCDDEKNVDWNEQLDSLEG